MKYTESDLETATLEWFEEIGHPFLQKLMSQKMRVKC